MNAVTNDELFDEILGRINHHDVRDDIERRVYEIALASLEAEPVAWMRDDQMVVSITLAMNFLVEGEECHSTPPLRCR
ncbi:hypothetical protein JW634_001823 [Escherichia coli]|uniref:hypothetical protein n=1 Tax=Escherichia coli TaxID=562 RepID=UPI001561B165|nr:hypothetical protein [Escherichia coli]EEZ5762606.1 hypothetical protein [Escherichia coli O140]EGR7368619.1 hypothetical protein [Escherichia coli]EHB6110704.1 hypothetical protein [Escherichia coli]EIP1031103.1 hypothetical protein [Escherichia coli]EMA1305609.1 hypothetical protein [Escherichia coli]